MNNIFDIINISKNIFFGIILLSVAAMIVLLFAGCSAEKYKIEYDNKSAFLFSKNFAKASEKVTLIFKNKYIADYGIGVTGAMGNVDPANASASVPGRVYFAIAKGNKTEVFYRELSPKPSRYEYKLAVAAEIAKELLERI